VASFTGGAVARLAFFGQVDFFEGRFDGAQTQQTRVVDGKVSFDAFEVGTVGLVLVQRVSDPAQMNLRPVNAIVNIQANSKSMGHEDGKRSRR